MTKRDWTSRTLTLLLALLISIAGEAAGAAGPAELGIWSAPYPRTLLFRGSEQVDLNSSYEEWAAKLETYDGIIGKAQDEILNRAVLLDRYTKYKKAHSQQMFLIHYLFRTRKEFDVGPAYFPGHWLHHGATRLREPLGADPAQTLIVVSEVDRIIGGAGVTVDICPVSADGKPDWKNAEAVTVTAVDPARSTLTVERASNNTAAHSFARDSFVAARVQQPVAAGVDADENLDLGSNSLSAGGRAIKVRDDRPTPEEREERRLRREQREERREERREPDAAAARQEEKAARQETRGSRTDGAVWWYNFAVDSPRNAAGRDATTAHAMELGRKFGSGGELEPFDGLAFDVYARELRAQDLAKGIDIDGNGVADPPEFCNQRYAEGVFRFAEALRQQLGPRRILVADGWLPEHQVNFGVFNGMESEGWPRGNSDADLRDWSGGLDRHLFWNANSFGDRPFSFFVYKFINKKRRVQVGNNIRRMFLAGAQFVDAPTATIDVPVADASTRFGSKFGWMDEERKGIDNRRGWLGRPLGPAVRMAKSSPDLIAGGKKGAESTDLVTPARSGSAKISRQGSELRISTAAGPVAFRLNPVPAQRGDLTVFATMRVAPLPKVASGATRTLRVRFLDSAGGKLLHESLRNLGAKPFEGVYSASALGAARVTIEFEVEGSADVWISRVSAHGTPDAVYREFEHGLVIANPSENPVTFDLAQVAPAAKFRRIKGSTLQDQKTNSGADEDRAFPLARDALFLAKR